MQAKTLLSKDQLVTVCLAIVTLMVLCTQKVLADDPVDQNKQREIAQAIERLESDRFNERETATRKLAAFGREAIAPLAKAASGNQREVTMRAITILKKHLESTDVETRNTAKKALEQIAAGPQATAARQAQQILNPPPPPEPEAPPARRIQVFRVPLQIRVQAAAAGNQRIRIKQVNGTMEIEVEEKNLKVSIKENPQNGIKMEVTEKKDGKETTKKYEAKDADDLAKKHPEAHKLYKKYTKAPNFNVRLPGFQQAIPLIPGQNQIPPIPNLRLPPGLIPQQARRSLDQAQEELDKSIKQLEETAKQLKIDTKDAENLRSIIDQLKSSRKKLDRAQSQLGGRQR